jgi:hypothetical protein
MGASRPISSASQQKEKAKQVPLLLPAKSWSHLCHVGHSLTYNSSPLQAKDPGLGPHTEVVRLQRCKVPAALLSAGHVMSASIGMRQFMDIVAASAAAAGGSKNEMDCGAGCQN